LSFETNHAKIKGLKIADPRGVFRGLTYGQWAGVWMNQLFSDKPDINYSGAKGMAFLRGNIEYAYKEDPEHPVFSTMTMESALKIQEDTAVFVPVVNTKFVLDNEYQGQVMKDEISMRNTARRDTVSGGDLGVRIREEPADIDYALVTDLNDYYVESPLFTLTIPENSTFKDSMESPLDAGQYFSVTAGVFVIISHWPKGKKYRLSVLGKGVGKYLTKSVYDIEVAGASPDLKDISTPPPPPSKPKVGSPPIPPTYDPMGFVGNWTDPKATK
jgi:hypothetical protein